MQFNNDHGDNLCCLSVSQFGYCDRWQKPPEKLNMRYKIPLQTFWTGPKSRQRIRKTRQTNEIDRMEATTKNTWRIVWRPVKQGPRPQYNLVENSRETVIIELEISQPLGKKMIYLEISQLLPLYYRVDRVSVWVG